MARLADLKGCKVGLDTVVFIYALDNHPTFGDRATKLFEQVEQGAIKATACDKSAGRIDGEVAAIRAISDRGGVCQGVTSVS